MEIFWYLSWIIFFFQFKNDLIFSRLHLISFKIHPSPLLSSSVQNSGKIRKFWNFASNFATLQIVLWKVWKFSRFWLSSWRVVFKVINFMYWIDFAEFFWWNSPLPFTLRHWISSRFGGRGNLRFSFPSMKLKVFSKKL